MNPLTGRRVLLTRPAGRNRGMFDLLARAGALAQSVSLIRIGPPAQPAALDSAVLALAAGDYDWVAFTSVNTVRAITSRAGELGLQPSVPASTRIAAVGPATAAALREAGLFVDLVPRHGGSADALAAAWPAPGAPHATVLLPVSQIGGAALADALAAAGYRLDTVEAYRTEPAPVPAPTAAGLASGEFDAVLLYSPSAARALGLSTIAPQTVVGAIGAPTADAARGAGLPPAFTAAEPTDTAMLDGLTAAFQKGHQ